MRFREEQLKAFKAFLVEHPECTRDDVRGLVAPWFVEWFRGTKSQHS